MWRHQVKQHLDAEEEEMEEVFGSSAALEQEKTGGSQILEASFNPNHQLHIIVVPTDVQKSVLIKEEAPEEEWPDVNKQDANCLHIKEEEEEQWTSLGEEPLNVKEETNVTSFSFTTLPLKSEDDEEKPLFSQLHQHQDEVRALLTRTSADHIESATGGWSCGGGGAKTNPDLNTCEDNSDSSETEDSEDDDVNNPDSNKKHLSDCRSKTEDTSKDGESFPSSIPELDGNAVDKNGQKPLSCDLCEQRFILKSSLYKHMRLHTGQKPFSCDLCDRRFTRKDHLKTHMMIHTGQKPFCCNLCEKMFTRKDHLKAHMITHTGLKPFCCDLCKQRFSEKSNLQKHMRIHTGQKPFSCDLCERRFALKYYLTAHMITHTGEKPFCCDFCEQRFPRMDSLNKHMRIHTEGKCHLK